MRLLWTGYAPPLIINTLMAPTYYIAKVYRQHNSLVIAVPKAVCIALNLKKGEHMVFTWQQSEGKFKFGKFRSEGVEDAAGRESPDRKDTGG